jgi:hypothetical protein
MQLHLDNVQFENIKGLFHMALILVVLFKVHVIDKKLRLLEKTFTHK